jgi:hypothetical protein
MLLGSILFVNVTQTSSELSFIFSLMADYLFFQNECANCVNKEENCFLIMVLTFNKTFLELCACR